MPFLKAPAFSILFICLLMISSKTLMASEPVSVKSGQYQTAVLELYTSEGCSSCPPADHWFNELTNTPLTELNVLALAFHVDYWDYIGWTDKFANPAYTNRQRHLARVNQQSTVYTPEFFVNGVEARGTGSVLEKIQATNKTLSQVDLELTIQQQNNKILLKLSSRFDTNKEPVVQFVIFENNLSSDVKDGENAGKKLHHQQVVQYLSPKKNLQPEIFHSISIKPQWNLDNLGIGALVQTKNNDHLQAIFNRLSAKKDKKSTN